MGLKAAVQALKKAEPLKDKVQQCKDLLNDNDAWICQQQLQKIYQQVLILDLEYALDRKVEQELWNLGFKNYIATLQSQAKDRKNPKRGESQAMLGWCLEAASGFYLTLLQEICTAFDLDLPFRRKNYIYGCSTPWKAVEKLSAPHKSSCFYACQYCLVHLGDIARYRNQNKQAELFYRHAVSLSPSSGQPYNQLALLEASRGDKLGTVFHYARSVAVKHPFPVATANLAKTLSSALNDNSFNIQGKTKLTSQEYITLFLKLHGILHNLGDFTGAAASHVRLLTETLTALVATESFSSWRLVQMLVINLYALHHTAGPSADSTELLPSDQLTSDETIARDCILDLIAGSLSALLLPVYTIKNAIIDYFALPTIKLCLDWMRLQPSVLEEPAFVSRLQIWPSLCVLLNGLQTCVAEFEHDQYSKVPLPEDRDLQGFLPLEKSFEALRFANTDLEGNVAGLKKLRAVRILSTGNYLAQTKIAGTSFINIVVGEGNERRFGCMNEGSGPSNELMKELEELSLNKERQPIVTNSPVPSCESASSKASSSETDIPPPDHSIEKRVGILKPQGSLERNRDSNAVINNTDTNTNVELLNCSSSSRKPRQNIAMQAIMRRAETEQKQVTFKNVSPMIIEELETRINEASSSSSSSSSSPPVPSPIKTIGTNPNNNNNNNNNTTNTMQKNGQPNGDLPPSQNPANGQKRAAANPSSSSSSSSSVHLTQPPASQAAPAIPPNQPTTPIQKQLELNISQAAPTQHQFLANEPTPQQRSQFPMHNHTSLSYPNQSFNVQNPQFSKNFVTSHAPNVPPPLPPPQYQIPAQYNGNLIQQNVHQSRTSEFQRLAQQAPPMMQQNPLAGPATSGIGNSLSQTLGLQQQTLQNVAAGLPQNMGIQGNNGIGMHRQNVMPNNMRTSQMNMHNQMNVTGPPSMINNVPGMSLMSGYQKNLQQGSAMPNIGNSPLSPTGISNIPINFNPNFGQNIYNQMNPKQQQQQQMSPSAYGKNSNQFVFPNQAAISKPPQQHPLNNYPIFHNYESTADFNLWKDTTQPPQPPVAWWGSAAAAAAAAAAAPPSIQNKESCTASDAFQSWANASGPAGGGGGSGMIGGRTAGPPLTPGNNYHQNPLLVAKHYNTRNSFDEARQFEMEQKQAQSSNTGNTYSLFSGNSWGVGGGGGGGQTSNPSNQDQPKGARLSQQSLWSGPGPSPLERLLEQQKSLREGGT